MSHGRRSRDIAEYPLLRPAIQYGRALVLTEVFRPGIHKKDFNIVVWLFEVAKDSPSERAVATANSAVFIDSLKKCCLLYRLYRIFNGDKNWTGVGVRCNLGRYDWHAPMNPRCEINGAFREL